MSFVSSDTKRYETQLLLAQMKQTKQAIRPADPVHTKVEQVTPQVRARNLSAMVAKARKALAAITNDPRLPLLVRDATAAVDDLFLGSPLTAEQLADYKKAMQTLKEQLQRS